MAPAWSTENVCSLRRYWSSTKNTGKISSTSVVVVKFTGTT